MIENGIKRIFTFFLAAALLFCVTACNVSEKAEDVRKPKYSVEFDYENMVFDGFSDGIDPDNWYIADKYYWGNDNGGVIKENVGYTDDGILVLAANGNYYKGDLRGAGERTDGTKTGAALVSKFMVRPGRYEIKMKLMPRIGACSAFWTFSKPTIDGKIENHEIDIEFPGNGDFRSIWNTSYINLETGGKEHYETPIEPVNDGEWHTYGFDWFTDPQRIVYYLDGKEVAEATMIVPYREGRLWLGVWFPKNWTGEPNFDTDYMFVDYVTYIPFKNQPCYDCETPFSTVAQLRDYPKSPVRIETVNKLADGKFDYDFSLTESSNAWTRGKLNSAGNSVSAEDLVVTVYDDVKKSKVLRVDGGGIASQYIDATYNGYTYDFTFRAKGKGSFQIMCYPASDTAITTETVQIDSTEWKTYTVSVTASDKQTDDRSEEVERMRVRIVADGDSSVYVDDIFAEFKGKKQ